MQCRALRAFLRSCVPLLAWPCHSPNIKGIKPASLSRDRFAAFSSVIWMISSRAYSLSSTCQRPLLPAKFQSEKPWHSQTWLAYTRVSSEIVLFLSTRSERQYAIFISPATHSRFQISSFCLRVIIMCEFVSRFLWGAIFQESKLWFQSAKILLVSKRYRFVSWQV